MSSVAAKFSSQDRFIPLRNHENAHYNPFTSPTYPLFQSLSNQKAIIPYDEHIRNNLDIEPKVLTWNENKPTSSNIHLPQDLCKNSSNRSDLTSTSNSTSTKGIRKTPEKILDAPRIRDDFYVNIMDWNYDGKLGVALEDEAFLYTPNQLIFLCKSSFSSYISSLKFYKSIVAIGNSRGHIEIYDLEKIALIRTLASHSHRVSSMDFVGNSMISGSKDKTIKLNDMRIQNCVVSTFRRHSGQICSLKAHPGNNYIFASGSNDNLAMVWDIRRENPIMELTGHKAAIKGLAWCPWKNGYLATGGGSNDKSIRLWNTIEESLLSTRETQSQVSSLLWNSKNQTLASSHGYPHYDLNIWKLHQHKLKKEVQLKGHKSRIISMVNSPDEDVICTASSDETLRFWRVISEESPLNSLFDRPRCSFSKIR